MTDKLTCKTPGCDLQILPATAERTGGFCMLCVQEKARIEEANYIAEFRVDVDRFEGVTDLVELLLLIHNPPPYDKLKNYLPYRLSTGTVYQQLTEQDTKRLISGSEIDDELFQTVASHLALFSNVDLTPIQRLLISKLDLYPPYVFRNAGGEVTQQLLKLAASNQVSRNLVLLALAWTQHPMAIEQFISWKDDPPSWAEELHAPLHTYTREAGYEVESGVARQLYYDRCYRITPLNQNETSRDLLLCSKASPDLSCPACGSAARNLLEFDDSLIAAAKNTTGSAPLAIPTCMHCVGMNEVFSRLDQDSQMRILTVSGPPPPPDHGFGELEEQPFSITERPPWQGVDWCLAEGTSQLGGMPGWINDANYPSCPQCARLMMFVGQLALEDVLEYGDGIIYSFRCDNCNTTATNMDCS